MYNAYFNFMEGVVDEDGETWEVVAADHSLGSKLVQIILDEAVKAMEAGVFRFDGGEQAQGEGTIQVVDDGTSYTVAALHDTSVDPQTGEVEHKVLWEHLVVVKGYWKKEGEEWIRSGVLTARPGKVREEPSPPGNYLKLSVEHWDLRSEEHT